MSAMVVFALPFLRRLAILAPLVALSGCSGVQLHQLNVPAGFAVELLADDVPDARGMAFGERGTLFVGTHKKGSVYALPYRADGTRSRAIVVAKDLTNPHGVAFRDGVLYVAERTRILSFADIESRLSQPPAPSVVFQDLPRYAHHGLRTLRFGVDGMLYVPVGAPCNICLPEEHYAVLMRLDLNAPSSQPQIYASGIRNTVGFDWEPHSDILWFTDNGRDLLGNDTPPDELNRAPRAGMHFGYPYCHGGELPDPQFGLQRACDEFEPPAQKLGAHVAALGMRFYTGNQFPERYRNAIFIAEHGSWNRKPKSGYRIAVVRLQAGKPVAYETFMDGWLQGDSAWGRPVDVLTAPDGAVLISDDQAGAIYRVTYRNSAR